MSLNNNISIYNVKNMCHIWVMSYLKYSLIADVNNTVGAILRGLLWYANRYYLMEDNYF